VCMLGLITIYAPISTFIAEHIIAANYEMNMVFTQGSLPFLHVEHTMIYCKPFRSKRNVLYMRDGSCSITLRLWKKTSDSLVSNTSSGLPQPFPSCRLPQPTHAARKRIAHSCRSRAVIPIGPRVHPIAGSAEPT
jgi:hypothetical protein